VVPLIFFTVVRVQNESGRVRIDPEAITATTTLTKLREASMR
jgi:hypothetical protein